MQLKVFFATLLRRWRLVVVAVVCTAGAAYLVVSAVGPKYEATGTVLLLPPGSTTQEASKSGTVGNPYLSLSGLEQARDIVIETLAAGATHEDLCNHQGDDAYGAMREELCKPRPGVTYEVTPDFTSSAPVVVITVEADSATNAATALVAVMDRVPKILVDLQTELNLRDRARIKSMPIVADRQPNAVRKSQIRAGIVAGAGTLGLGLLMIALLDGYFVARRTTTTQREQVAVVSAGADEQPSNGQPEQVAVVSAGADEQPSNGQPEQVAVVSAGADEQPSNGQWGQIADDWPQPGWQSGQTDDQPQPVTDVSQRTAAPVDWTSAKAMRK